MKNMYLKLYKQEILQCLAPSFLSFLSCSSSVSGQIFASPLGWLLSLASGYCDDSYTMSVGLWVSEVFICFWTFLKFNKIEPHLLPVSHRLSNASFFFFLGNITCRYLIQNCCQCSCIFAEQKCSMLILLLFCCMCSNLPWLKIQYKSLLWTHPLVMP